MANYGPPDGTAGEPWRSRDAYGRPERGRRDGGPVPGPHPDDHPGYDDRPRYDVPHAGYGASGHGGSPGYGPQPYRAAYQPQGVPGPTGYGGDPVPPTRPSRGRGPLVAVLAAVVLLALGGGATVAWLLGRAEGTPAASPTAPAAAASPAPTGETSPVPSVAAPESSADPRFVKVGQCVRNDGPPDGKPKLLISECAPQSYEVLHRVNGPTTGEKDAEAKCAEVDGYTNWYFFDSQLDTLDFVLCLKQR